MRGRHGRRLPVYPRKSELTDGIIIAVVRVLTTILASYSTEFQVSFHCGHFPKKDYFILEGATIEQAAMQIEKRFNVKVIITNENLKKCTISAWFLNNESLEQVIKGVSAVQQATFTIKDDLITIEGGIGCGE